MCSGGSTNSSFQQSRLNSIKGSGVMEQSARNLNDNALAPTRAEQEAQIAANLALATSRRRRRAGSLINGGRTVLGAPSGGSIFSSAGRPTVPSPGTPPRSQAG